MKVQVNDCFEPLTEFSVVPGVVRVLYLNERYDAVVLIQLTDPPSQPIGLGLEELRGSVIAGDTKLAKVVTPEFLLVLEDDLDEKKKREREEKWNIIAPLIDSGYPGQIFAPGEMGQMVGARAIELGIQRKSIYRLLYRYWINGQVRNALLKNYVGVGVPERKYDPAKPPGRKPRYQGIAALRI